MSTDPTKILASTVRLARKLINAADDGLPVNPLDVERFAAIVLKLHGHMSNSGEMPKQWQPCSQCGPLHADKDGLCLRHGKRTSFLVP